MRGRRWGMRGGDGMMLSSIGPRKYLEEHYIEVIHDLPGADHPSVPVAWEIPLKESTNQVAVSPLNAALDVGKYLLFRTGIFSFPAKPCPSSPAPIPPTNTAPDTDPPTPLIPLSSPRNPKTSLLTSNSCPSPPRPAP
ncbi:hypothetical protein EYC80_003571 [Monilinia laxa]|uniref:Uncharacterized protein n=1 Tax=Monilinia laxa TaxID=61186 RepID=A0A5N6KKB8_MONLA|nr:hypothetical protein EYC80_003571 [Monilinia laxa]